MNGWLLPPRIVAVILALAFLAGLTAQWWDPIARATS